MRDIKYMKDIKEMRDLRDMSDLVDLVYLLDLVAQLLRHGSTFVGHMLTMPFKTS